jgi:hypothetical protein
LGRHKVTTTSDNFGIARRITVSARTWAKKLPTRPVSGASWQSSTSTSHRGRGGSTLRTLGLPAPPPVNVQLTPHTPQNAHCSARRRLTSPPSCRHQALACRPSSQQGHTEEEAHCGVRRLRCAVHDDVAPQGP